jgi:hypothetical protein
MMVVIAVVIVVENACILVFVLVFAACMMERWSVEVLAALVVTLYYSEIGVYVDDRYRP